MKNRIIGLSVLFMILFIAGCGPGNNKFDLSALKKIAANEKERLTGIRKDQVNDISARLKQEMQFATGTLPFTTGSLPMGRPDYAKITIVIDPGHGNPGNPGAVGPTGVLEKDVILDIGYRLKSLLERDGFKVIMTRTGSESELGNPERAEVANKNKADLFLRLHADSSKNPFMSGTRTLWYRDDSLQAAQLIQQELAKATALPDLGVRRQYLVGFFYAKVPSVAVEVAYLSNPREEQLLSEPAFQQRTADGLYRGIVQYIDWAALFKAGIITSTLPTGQP